MPTAQKNLYNLGYQTVRELETENGILASGRNEIYGGIFGRDSLITSLKLLQVHKKTKNEDCLRIVKKSLKTLANLQGQEINPESGEEPGKIIHEFRPDNHDHLTKNIQKPWYVYPDNSMRNYDTIDAAPLFLITAYRYLQQSHDNVFIETLLPNIKAAINWIIAYGDTNGDGLIDYNAKTDREFDGPFTDNWMDHPDTIFHENGLPVRYPLAPVEVQAYAYLALRLWGTYFKDIDDVFAEILQLKAQELKDNFNETYLVKTNKEAYFAFNIDGAGKQLVSRRSNVGHALWASLTIEDDGVRDSIIEKKYIPLVVKQLLSPDIFEPKGGVRTLSLRSRNFQPNGYHNGTIWPHDNSMIAEGFENFGFKKEANQIRKAYLNAIAYFNTPIELFSYWNGTFFEQTDFNGRSSCRQQAWSAASVLADTLQLQSKSNTLFDKLFGASVMLMLFNEVSGPKLHSIIEKSLLRFTDTVPIKKITLPKKLPFAFKKPLP